MGIPKSKVASVQSLESADYFTKPRGTKKQSAECNNPETATVKIKPIKCCNDFVAILQTEVKSTIELADTNKFSNEGIVVGVGPGLPTNGIRCASQLAIGDVVSFFGNPSMVLTPSSGLYSGRRVVIYPERSIICHLPPIDFVVVDSNE